MIYDCCKVLRKALDFPVLFLCSCLCSSITPLANANSLICISQPATLNINLHIHHLLFGLPDTSKMEHHHHLIQLPLESGIHFSDFAYVQKSSYATFNCIETTISFTGNFYKPTSINSIVHIQHFHDQYYHLQLNP